MAGGPLVVCVPARDEEKRLPSLLDALAGQSTRAGAVVVALNNTSDNSREAVEAAIHRHPLLNIVIDETFFAAPEAHAGSARRRAMDIAADLAGQKGLVLTTDADTRPPPDWIAANLASMAAGLDVVGGRIVVDENEPMTEAVAAACSLADRYWAHVRELEDAVDPVPWDPQPRHGDHTGASLCVAVAAYRGCGGVPMLRTGEDRALVQAIVRRGGRLAHPASIWTRVSPRVDGRAADGMAEHMKRLETQCRGDGRVMLPSFAQWRARAVWRRAIRERGGAPLVAELEERLLPMVDDMILDGAAFEAVA